MVNPRFDDQVIFQVAFVTDDIEKTKKWFADMFSMKVPETIVTGPLSETRAEYHGRPMDSLCKLAFFEFGNVTVELLEPDEKPSCWRDILERKGPGFHHFAFKVRGMKDKIAAFEKGGYPLLQRGEFAGGRYAYVDTEKQYGALLELLEFDRELTA
jgi:catechol 2,3-dioxygenase-like lactoylglutathione lyase family enzyme